MSKKSFLEVNATNEDPIVIVKYNSGELIGTLSEGYVLGKKKDFVTTDYGALSTSNENYKSIDVEFIKVNDAAISKVKKNREYITLLLPYVAGQTGYIIYANNRLVKDTKGICMLLGINKNTGFRVVRELIQEDVIHKQKEGGFTFNPFIALRGMKATSDLYEEFKNTEYRIYNRKGKNKC